VRIKFLKEVWVFFKKNPIKGAWHIFWYIPAVISLTLFCIFVSIKHLDYEEFIRVWEENT